MVSESVTWKPELAARTKPAYLAIADAMAADVAAGRLSPGQRLPPQRALADLLGLDLTTVSRAYAEARRRGLLDARVGQGTFVRAGAGVAVPAVARLVDMGMNQPPLPADPAIAERLRHGLMAVATALRPWDLLRYPEAEEQAEARAAGAAWLSQRLADPPVERIVPCPGGQSALLALLSLLTHPGDTVCAEALTYPGFKVAAAQLGLRAVGVPMDRDGLDPEALERVFALRRPKAFYTIPTLHNPATATLPLARRQKVVELARAYDVPILEDDIYGPLALDAPPPLAALAPESVYYLSSLAKCLSPVLRIAYVLAPDSRQAHRLGSVLRATALASSPLTAAVARRWIQDGTAGAVLEAIREEARARNRLAHRYLPPACFVTQPEAFHLWLTLPEGWSRGEFAAAIRARGIAAATSDAFAVATEAGQTPPEALRICLGAPIDRAETERVLEILAETLDQFPAGAAVI